MIKSLPSSLLALDISDNCINDEGLRILCNVLFSSVSSYFSSDDETDDEKKSD